MFGGGGDGDGVISGGGLEWDDIYGGFGSSSNGGGGSDKIRAVSTWGLVAVVTAAVRRWQQEGNRGSGGEEKKVRGYLRESGRVSDGGDGEADDCVEGGGGG